MSPPPSGPPAAVPPVRRREVLGWALFDFANSGFTTLIVTVAFSVFFTRTVAPAGRGDAYWGLAIGISGLGIVLLAPLIGAAADAGGRKKTFLAGTWLVCCLATAALAAAGPGTVLLAITCFVVANIAFELGVGLISAFLPELATPATMGRISGIGWGLGYLGGLACLLLTKPLLAGGFGVDNLPALRQVWLLTAAFFLLAGAPTFLLLRERAPRRTGLGLAGLLAAAGRRLRTTAGEVRRYRDLLRFLIVTFCASSGLGAVIAFSAVYAERTIGFSPGQLVALFLTLQLTAAAGAVSCGWLQDRLGARRALAGTLLLWLAVCLGAAAVRTPGAYWVVALTAGLGIGALQSTVRAAIGLLSPSARSGEFYGFWALVGRLAAACGPLVFGLVSSGTGSQRLAVLAVAGFFLAALLGLAGFDEERGRRAAAES